MTNTERTIIDLSHPITDGMETYPGLPTPSIATHLSREAAEDLYGPGVRFHVGMISLCTNTGTYVDVPFHRYDNGADLARQPIDRLADVPGHCVDRRGAGAIQLGDDDLAGCRGKAVLIHTGHSRHFGTARYTRDHPHLTASAADRLVEAGVACVGIDSLNIDSIDDLLRPVHSTLLGVGVPIIEHLTDLDRLPADGFRFSAVPPGIVGAGTFPVRAYAIVGR